MRSGLLAMTENLVVVTAGKIQGDGKWKKAIEESFVVNMVGQNGYVRGKPRLVNANGTKGICKNIPQ